MSVIVVGVDHSAAAKEALRLALGEVLLRQAALRAIHAFGASDQILGEELLCPVRSGVSDGVRAAAEVALDVTLEEVAPGAHDGKVERRVVEGAPAAVPGRGITWRGCARRRSRGHGSFAELLLGPVSQRCVNDAEFPVVIVRSRADTH
jgi:nucleotide-binding universal stress UspA family protein